MSCNDHSHIVEVSWQSDNSDISGSMHWCVFNPEESVQQLKCLHDLEPRSKTCTSSWPRFSCFESILIRYLWREPSDLNWTALPSDLPRPQNHPCPLCSTYGFLLLAISSWFPVRTFWLMLSNSPAPESPKPCREWILCYGSKHIRCKGAILGADATLLLEWLHRYKLLWGVQHM